LAKRAAFRQRRTFAAELSSIVRRTTNAAASETRCRNLVHPSAGTVAVCSGLFQPAAVNLAENLHQSCRTPVLNAVEIFLGGVEIEIRLDFHGIGETTP